MFHRKANPASPHTASSKPTKTRESIPTIITQDVHLIGNLVSEGAVDFSGAIDGNIRSETFTLRPQGSVKGEIVATTVHIQGTVKGLIRAKNVHLLASCKVEGIIIHEQLSIEDGAFVDGKFKRSDRVIEPILHEAHDDEGSGSSDSNITMFQRMGGGSGGHAGTSTSHAEGNVRVLENIRLIR